ncbi:hypothetical protein BGY98DRAFT_677749 [Russula aff. rugulosa BPL654]|nr:hypothetical protein BGY98DRAFT_677749 [Russula aff. rugulosa BPL654]
MDNWHTTVWKLSELHKAKIIIVISAIEGENGRRTCRVRYMVGFVGMVTALVSDGRFPNIDIVIRDTRHEFDSLSSSHSHSASSFTSRIMSKRRYSVLSFCSNVTKGAMSGVVRISFILGLGLTESFRDCTADPLLTGADRVDPRRRHFLTS